MTPSLYSIDSLPERLVHRWNELLHELPVKSAFLSHAFCAAVQKVRGGVFVLHIIGDKDEEGFLPFQMKTGRRFLGHAEKVAGSMSDYFGFIGNLGAAVDPDDLLRGARLSSLRFDHAPPALCPFAFTERETGYGMRLRVRDFEEFISLVAATNKQFLNRVQRAERRARSNVGALEFAWRSTLADADHLIAAKRQQYKDTGMSDALGQRWRQELVKRLCTMPAPPDCDAVLSSLHAGNCWLASHLALVCKDTLHVWFPVHNREFGKYWPGHLLLFRMIEQACNEGITTFDFGEGVSHYKLQYGGHTYEVLKGVLRLDTVAGHADPILQALGWRVRTWLNRAAVTHSRLAESERD